MNALNGTRLALGALALAALGGFYLLSDVHARPQGVAGEASATVDGVRPSESVLVPRDAPMPKVPPVSPVTYSAGVSDVLRLLDAGVSEEIINAYVRNAPVAYALNASEIIALKDREVPSAVVLSMLARGGELRARAMQQVAATPWLEASVRTRPAAGQPTAVYSQPVEYVVNARADTLPYYYWYSYSGYPTYSYWVWSPFYCRYPYYRGGYCYPRGWPYHHSYRQFAGHRPYYAPAASPAFRHSVGIRSFGGGRPGFNARPVGFSGRGAGAVVSRSSGRGMSRGR